MSDEVLNVGVSAPDGSGGEVDLLGRVAAGDARALAEFYDRYAGRVYSLVRRICGEDSAAEDVTQEVFLTIWRTAGRFDAARGSITTWVLTLAHHKAVDAARRSTTTTRRHTEVLTEDGRELPPRPGADVAAADSIMAGHVRHALAALGLRQRQVLALAYYGGHTQPETARIVGIPLGTVKSRTLTAMTRLRTHLRFLDDTR